MVGEMLHVRRGWRWRGHFAAWAVAAVVTLGPCGSAAQAWGGKAHRLVAAVAESLLDQKTADRIAELTGGMGLVPLAIEADQLRTSRPETAPWHYVNIPRGAAAYDPLAHCSKPAAGDCVVAAIQRFEAQLADAAAPRAVRVEALMFLTHLVADIHQPLHCLADFRGGNEVLVEFLGQRTRPGTDGPWTLHAVWDTGLLEYAGVEEAVSLARLHEELRQRSRPEPPLGTPEDWAMESHRLAVEVAMNVPDSGRIDDRYVRRSLRVVEDQLARAGHRLAAMLQAVLGEAEPE